MAKTTRILLIGSIGLLMTAAVVIAQAAPMPGDASLTVDQQIHLGLESSIFKEGELFLWDHPASWATAVGREALESNTSGTGNTAVGNRALLSNSIGNDNTAVGTGALISNTIGNSNTALGARALHSNIGYDPGTYDYGGYNTAVGARALQYNEHGSENTAVGHDALQNNTSDGAGDSGSGNVAVGAGALRSNNLGDMSTAVGTFALSNNTNGTFNTAVGSGAMGNSDFGTANTAIGHQSLFNISGGDWNSGLGQDALWSNSIGYRNAGLGARTLFNNTSGSDNIAVGYKAGHDLGYGVVAPGTSMSHDIFIGNVGQADEANVIRIGTAYNDAGGGTGQNRTFIAGIVDQTLTMSASQVCVEATGQLGKCPDPSSRRYKEDIQDMAGVDGHLQELRPVTFRFKKEIAGQEEALQFGLIAEEVAEVIPELVVFDDEGQPEAVRYRFLSSILLSEVQQQAEELNDLRARLRAVEKKLLE